MVELVVVVELGVVVEVVGSWWCWWEFVVLVGVGGGVGCWL